MSTKVLNSDREFQVWKYTVSHGQLLLRSTKSPDCSTRIDVLFKGVSEFHLPASFVGLSITDASDSEVRILCTLRKTPSLQKDVRVFKLQGKDFLGYVAALAVFCHEDEGEYYDPSFFAKNNIL